MSKNKVGRNDPCHCGSGLKYKKCHGDVVKKEICYAYANHAMKEKMKELIKKELNKKIKNEYDELTKGDKNE